MDNLDIIILAAVTAFILARLWFVLGRRNDDERERPNPFAAPPQGDDEEDVVLLPKPEAAQGSSALTLRGHSVYSLAGALDKIKEKDPFFDEKQFLQGSKAAFTMIVEAFAHNDLAPAARWLAPPVRESFQKAITARQAAGKVLEGHVERVAEAEVAAARLEDSWAYLTVQFTSIQANITRNAEGQIIAGAPGQTEEIHDTWVFARDLKADDPNWQLVETRS